MTSENIALPSTLAAETKSPTCTSEIDLISPDTSWTDSEPEKQDLNLLMNVPLVGLAVKGAGVGKTVGLKVFVIGVYVG